MGIRAVGIGRSFEASAERFYSPFLRRGRCPDGQPMHAAVVSPYRDHPREGPFPRVLPSMAVPAERFDEHVRCCQCPKGLEGGRRRDGNVLHRRSEGNSSTSGSRSASLSSNSTFEETVFLLWNKVCRSRTSLDELTQNLQRYEPAQGMEQRVTSLPKTAEPMHVLRTLVSSLAMYDSDPNANDVDAAQDKAPEHLGTPRRSWPTSTATVAA